MGDGGEVAALSSWPGAARGAHHRRRRSLGSAEGQWCGEVSGVQAAGAHWAGGDADRRAQAAMGWGSERSLALALGAPGLVGAHIKPPVAFSLSHMGAGGSRGGCRSGIGTLRREPHERVGCVIKQGA